MCLNPLSAVGTAISVVGGISRYAGAKKAAKAQDRYNTAVYNQQLAYAKQQAEYQRNLALDNARFMQENFDNAIKAQSSANESVLSRVSEEELASKVRLEQMRIDRLKAIGALSASEKTGRSAQLLLQDFYRQEGKYAAITGRNNELIRRQAARELVEIQTQTESRINSARPYIPAPINLPVQAAPATQPSLLGTALEIGSGVLGAYNRYSYKPTVKIPEPVLVPEPKINSYFLDKQSSISSFRGKK